VPIARFLRIVTFQPGGLEAPLDVVLREAIVPRLLDRDEIVDAWIGRHGSPSDRTRVVASTWSEEPSGPAADLAALHDPGLAEHPPAIDSVEQLGLAVNARFERLEPARVLRVFHGIVRPGELDAYVGEARRGMAADAAVNEGLIALMLGTEGSDSFVTVSAWTDWSAIEDATGGNTKRPFATRNSARLASFRVAHFEILPEAPTRR
jgi:hypothetical protein